jgi:predicted RNase H-like HicB family nuclease
MSHMTRRLFVENANFPIWKSHMKSFNYVVERCPDTSHYVGYASGFPGVHSQAKSLDELRRNMMEVIELLIMDGHLTVEEFINAH